MVLIHAADAAYPFDYHLLPDDVKVILGYVGGYTPHVWTADEIRDAVSHGYEWWAIWTAPQRELGSPDGYTAAEGMVTVLKGLGYDRRMPVFLDVEPATYSIHPAGANACISTWKSTMCLSNYVLPLAYTPLVGHGDWVANWTGNPPKELLPDAIGEQYISDKMLGKPFDLSMFDSSLIRYKSAKGRKMSDTFLMYDTPRTAPVLVSGGVAVALGSHSADDGRATRTALINAGVPEVQFSHTDFVAAMSRFGR